MIRVMSAVLLVMICLMPGTSPTYASASGAYEYWGAIAYSSATGRYGQAYDHATQAKAINFAVANCRAHDCKAVVWFKNSCGAFAKGDQASGWGTGNNQVLAQENALAECRKRGGGCKIITWACTTR